MLRRMPKCILIAGACGIGIFIMFVGALRYLHEGLRMHGRHSHRPPARQPLMFHLPATASWQAGKAWALLWPTSIPTWSA